MIRRTFYIKLDCTDFSIRVIIVSSLRLDERWKSYWGVCAMILGCGKVTLGRVRIGREGSLKTEGPYWRVTRLQGLFYEGSWRARGYVIESHESSGALSSICGVRGPFIEVHEGQGASKDPIQVHFQRFCQSLDNFRISQSLIYPLSILTTSNPNLKSKKKITSIPCFDCCKSSLKYLRLYKRSEFHLKIDCNQNNSTARRRRWNKCFYWSFPRTYSVIFASFVGINSLFNCSYQWNQQ